MRSPSSSGLYNGAPAQRAPTPWLAQEIVDALPAHFPVTDRQFQLALGLPADEVRRETLRGAAEAGRRYLTDCAILKDIPCQQLIGHQPQRIHLANQPVHRGLLLYRKSDEGADENIGGIEQTGGGHLRDLEEGEGAEVVVIPRVSGADLRKLIGPGPRGVMLGKRDH